MIAAVPFAYLLANDPLAPVQKAIVTKLAALLPGVRVVTHPGKVDLSELVARSVVTSPGIGVGWSRIRRAMMMDGSFGAAVEWTAYIVAEAKVVDSKRVEKEMVGFSIGQQILRILSDAEACFWDLTGVMPPEDQPSPELKPFFTIRDAAAGTAYYVVTWTQLVADIGETLFPTATATTDPEAGTVTFEDQFELAKHFFPAREVDDDA
jgi:hypothetical protein